jgi:hypothetical protein
MKPQQRDNPWETICFFLLFAIALVAIYTATGVVATSPTAGMLSTNLLPPRVGIPSSASPMHRQITDAGSDGASGLMLTAPVRTNAQRCFGPKSAPQLIHR